MTEFQMSNLRIQAEEDGFSYCVPDATADGMIFSSIILNHPTCHNQKLNPIRSDHRSG